jgi:hypothetical protein
VAPGALNASRKGNPLSAFMVNTNVMVKVVTAILLNLDTFDGENTCRAALLAAPADTQKEAETKIGKKLFLLNRRALRARYGCGEHLSLPEFVFVSQPRGGPSPMLRASLIKKWRGLFNPTPQFKSYRA